ncbi:MAG: SH3-like domain-containing protein, partial [Nitrososphaerales archaeon]
MPKEFALGQRVRIRREEGRANRRVPEYARGGIGTIVRFYGVVTGNRHDHAEEWGPLYDVLLDPAPGSSGERLLLDVHAPWLEETDADAVE